MRAKYQNAWEILEYVGKYQNAWENIDMRGKNIRIRGKILEGLRKY